MSVTLKKEWIGESGYCNCLLVVMARVPIQRVELFSHETPPNLEAMALWQPDTLAWLRAQEFDYSDLDTTEIIQTLASSAGITKSIWQLWRYESDSTGYIHVHDCVENDGPVVGRRYDLRLQRLGNTLHLTVVLN